MKRVVTMLLSLVLVLSMLAGCANTNAPAESEGVKEETAAVTENEKEEEQEEEKEVVSLRLVMYGDTTPRREEYLKNEFHDAVLEELKIDLSVEFLPWGSTDVVQTMLAAGEAFALEHRMDQADYAQKGYLAEITMDQIEENCPNYLRMRENNGFECVKFEGKIYILPIGCKANAGRSQMITVREDIMDELGYKTEDITTTEELLELFAAVKEAYPDMRVMMDNRSMYRLIGTELVDMRVSAIKEYAYVDDLAEDDKVYSFYESQLFEDSSKFNAQLVEAGYIIPDEFIDSSKKLADWSAGNCFARTGVPGEIIERNFVSAIPDAKIGRITIGDFPYTMTLDYDWGFSISASEAENTERWLELFDWMYKDQETYDFCVYGVEGKDWERAEDGTIKKLVTDSFWDDWFLQANCYQSYSSEIDPKKIEIYENTDKEAILSKSAGFTLDTSMISAEIAMLDAAKTEYMDPIQLGYVDYDENYEAALQKMKEAGLDTVMAEYQRQFSEWYANK